MLSTHPGVRWFIISWFVTALGAQNLYFCENEDPCVAANEKAPYEPEARSSNCGITNTLCDRYIPPGWYRYNDRMLDHCPALGSCGSIYANWLNGSHPIGVNSEIERIVCKVGFSGCCERQYKIKIRNCGLYMAYCLPALDTCPERYCFGETGSCVLTNSFSTTEAITERIPTTSQSTMEQTTESTPKTDLGTTQTITEPKPTTSQSTAESITERTPTTNPSTTETITEHKPTTSQSTAESITERTPTTNPSTTEPITKRTLITSQSPTEPITEHTPTTNLSTTEPITERTSTTKLNTREPITEPTLTTSQSTIEPVTERTPTTDGITERTSLASQSTIEPIPERSSTAYSTRLTVTVTPNITELSSTSPSTSTSTSETENIATSPSSTEPSTTDFTTSTKKTFLKTTKATTISVISTEGNAISAKPHETAPPSPTSSMSDTTSPVKTTRMSGLTTTGRRNGETTTTSGRTTWVTSAKVRGESSLGVMPIVAIVTVACVMLVAVISATIYKIRQTDRRLDRQPDANRKGHLNFHLRLEERQTEQNEYQEIESVTENDSIQDGGYASVEPATSADDSEENVYENEITYRDHHHPTPCGNNGVHNPASIERVYDSII